MKSIVSIKRPLTTTINWTITLKFPLVAFLCVGLVTTSEISQVVVSGGQTATSFAPDTCNLADAECLAATPNVKSVRNATHHSVVTEDASVSLISRRCRDQLEYLVRNYDKFGNQSNNIVSNLQAHVNRLKDVWIGTFDECVSLRGWVSVPSSDDVMTIRGQYCLSYFLPPSLDQMSEDERSLIEGTQEPFRYPTPIPQTGLCLPDSCSVDDVQQYLIFLLKESASNYTIFVPQAYCQTDKPKPMTLAAILVVSGIILILALAVVGTALEISTFTKKRKADSTNKDGQNMTQSKDSVSRSVLKSFGLVSNSRSLFKMDTVLPGEIDGFNGTKFIQTIGCQTTHVLLLAGPNGFSNTRESPYLQSFNHHGFFYIQLLLQVAVAMSGCGITTSALHRIQKDKGFNILAFYWRRLWRLSVSYYVVIALIVGIAPYLGSGPRWPDVESASDICRQYWWTNVFYINNYISDRQCEEQTWYMAVDMQLCLIAPLFILALQRSAGMGFTLISAAISFSVGKIFYHAYYDSLNAWDLSVDPLTSKVWRYFRQLYLMPFSRLGCYCTGIAAGYLIHTYGRKIPINKRIHRWAPTVATVIIFSPVWLWYRSESTLLPTPSHLEGALCEAFSRILFTSATVYIAISMYTGQQDGITRVYRRILCRKFFAITSKLHYSVYLLHVIITRMYVGSLSQPMEFSAYQYLKVVFILLLLTHLVAIPFTLLVVSPFARLERIIEDGFSRMQLKEKTVEAVNKN